MEKEEIKKILRDFAAFCKKNGGTSWYEIPEEGIDWYLREKFGNDVKCPDCGADLKYIDGELKFVKHNT